MVCLKCKKEYPSSYTWPGNYCPRHGGKLVGKDCSCGTDAARSESFPYCGYCGKTEAESDQAKVDAAQAGEEEKAEGRAHDTAGQEATGN